MDTKISTPKTNKNDKITWPTSFPNFQKLKKSESRLNDNSMITFQKPRSLCSLLTNYKCLSFNSSTNFVNGCSSPCGHCSLCGSFGAHSSMVTQTTSIKTPTGTIKLKQNLTSDNYGI